MAKAIVQPRTIVSQVLETDKVTAKELENVIERPLGSPINGMEVGKERNVTLTGKIEIREFNGTKGAYFTTKEGISIKVNASFDPTFHKAGSVHTIVCKEFVRAEGNIKFAAFVDLEAA